MSEKLKKRSEIRPEDTWDLESLYQSEQDWEEALQEVEAALAQFEPFQNRILESSDSLHDLLKLNEELTIKLIHLSLYAHRHSDVDTKNSHYRGLVGRVSDLGSKFSAATSFIEPEILANDDSLILGYLETDERLKVYAHMIEVLLKQKPHILSLNEETLLAKASVVLGSSSSTFSILNNADLKLPMIANEIGQEVPLSHARYSTFLESTNRNVRENAFRGMYEAYGQYRNTFASTLSSTIKYHNFLADIRHFSSAREKALFNNHIDESVYDALIESVTTRIDLLHRYVDLRKRVLNLDDIRMYDLYVPMVEEVDLAITYEEAKTMVIEALSVLGEEYTNLLHKAFNERWIDPFENEGKRSGAYSSGAYGTKPFILLNWQDTLDNVYTLAHELGHSIHTYYSTNNQPFVYSSYSIFLAEVASTTNENLLTDYLLKKYDDPKIRAYIINHYLDGVKGTVYRQTQFAQFEHLIHTLDQKGTPLTADLLSEKYGELNKFYYGEAMTYDDEISLEWARIPHFYYDYYVYQYATGFSAASALADKILNQGQEAIDAYLNYLKAGSSDYPIEVLKKAGVDMSTPKATNDALNLFEQRLTELEELLIK